MKKKIKILSLILAVILIAQTMIFSATAFDNHSLTEEEWQARYENLIDENTLPMLCVGANETELNITWHAAKDNAYPEVRLADNAEMNNAKTFTGETVAAENDEQLVCRVTMTGIEKNTTYYKSR